MEGNWENQKNVDKSVILFHIGFVFSLSVRTTYFFQKLFMVVYQEEDSY